MAQFNTRELRGWALKGAEQRLVEIAAEAGAIYKAFPELRGRSRSAGTVADTTPAPAAPSARRGRARTRGRRQMSEEGRNRIAEAARRRWAEWRSKRGQGAEPPAADTPAPAAAGRAPKKR